MTTPDANLDPAAALTVVTRDIALDLDADEAWRLVGDEHGWADWLVDDADVDVAEGAHGEVFDDGERREVIVTRVEPGRSVEFVWWPVGDADRASRVTIAIDLDTAQPHVLRITETFPERLVGASARAALRWEVRAAAAWTASRARART